MGSVDLNGILNVLAYVALSLSSLSGACLFAALTAFLLKEELTGKKPGENKPNQAGEADPEKDTEELIQQAVKRLFEERRWQEWRQDTSRPVNTPTRPLSMYEMWDAYIRKASARELGMELPDPEALGLYKFTEGGECITLPSGSQWLAVAYELNSNLLDWEAQHPLDVENRA